MMKTKLMTLSLACAMALSVSAFAAQPQTLTTPQAPSISIKFDKEGKLAALEEKGLNLQIAMAEKDAKMAASGKTQEQIDAMMAKMTGKFEELKAAKALEIQQNKANRTAMQATTQGVSV